MPIESPALLRVKPSATMAASAKARALRREGRSIIALAGGEPDFDTPQNIKAAAKRAIDTGKTKYTDVDGIPDLKAAIAEKFERENGLSFSTEEISVAPGGKAIIFNAMLATLAPGDEVVIPSPYWVSYPDIVRMVGGEPVIATTTAATNFLMTPKMLDAAITPRTRWLILNSPSNPSGATYSATGLKQLADVLLRHPQVRVLSDDIYEHILYDNAVFTTIAQVEPALRDRVLTVNGVSKAYAMTGWRVGFAGGPAPMIKAMAKVMSQSTSNPCSISQWAAVEALSGPQDAIAEHLTSYQARRDLVVALLNEAPGLRCPKPVGAFYVFPSCEGLLGRKTAGGRQITDDATFVTELLEAEGVAVVQGSAFGSPNFFRASYATALDDLTDACHRIGRFCSSLS